MGALLTKLLMNGMVLFARLEVWVLPRRWLLGHCRFAARHLMRRKATRDALFANGRRLLGPEATDDELTEFGEAVIRNFGHFFVTLLRAPRDFPSEEELVATMRGREHGDRLLAAQQKSGQGMIGLTLHMGCYELAAVLSQRFQPAAVVYRPDPFGLVEKLRSRTRMFASVGEIHTHNPLFGVAAMDLLRRGGSVFAAGDIGFAGESKGVDQDFLGGRAPFHTWPARMSIATGAPILPSYVVWEPEGDDPRTGNWRVQLDEPIFPEECGGDLERVMARLVASYERAVQAYPEQWLILHRYWRDA